MKRNRIWLIGLALLTASLLIFVGYSSETKTLPVQAQEASPSPTPQPETSPTATEVLPSPVESPVAEEELEPALVPLLPLADEPYQNPSLGYQIGVVEGYKQSSVAGVPLIESSALPVPGSESPKDKSSAIVLPPGSIAYTVAVRPRANDSSLNEAALTQVAIDTFARGEGFLVGDRAATLGGVKISWQGSLTQGRKSQPVKGIILSRQVEGKLLLLLVAGSTDRGDSEIASSFLNSQIESVFETVAGSLEPLEP